MIQKSVTYLETSAEMVQMLNFEYALLLTLCTATVVWPETSVPSQTAPVHRESSNCQCSATTTRTSATCVSCTYVCVCVCTSVYSRTCDRPLSPLIITNGVSQALASKVWVTGQESNSRTMESFLYLTS